VDESPPRLVVDRRDLHAATDQLLARRLDVRDDDLEPGDRARRGVRDPGPEGDRAGRPGWRELNEPQLVVDLVIVVEHESHLVSVERDGTIDVGHGNGDELELPVHG
jgi:hypothetical protein